LISLRKGRWAIGPVMRGGARLVANQNLVAIASALDARRRKSESDNWREPFGMAFSNYEAAVILATQLNRRSGGLWFYKVERHIDNGRWITVRERPQSSNATADCAKRMLLAAG
jgi:hypothetical protein